MHITDHSRLRAVNFARLFSSRLESYFARVAEYRVQSAEQA